MKPIRVFLSLRFSLSRGSRTSKVIAEWVGRGTGGQVYRSKPCDARGEAVKLALAWLARQNVGECRYVDTTENAMERFGYSQ